MSQEDDRKYSPKAGPGGQEAWLTEARMKTPRKPDYRLKIKEKGSPLQAVVGAGWENADGSVSIKINPLIKVELSSEFFITLFPVEFPPSLEPE
jgi:hypothetical protein